MKKRILTLICVLSLLLTSGILPGAMALGNLVADSLRGVEKAPPHDISVMSFNVLEKNTSDSGYAPGSVRVDAMIKTVKTYMPDIVGTQEVSDRAYNAKPTEKYYYAWCSNLPAKMEALGYDWRSLDQESVNAGAGNTIGAGLIIFYKRDRFKLSDDRTTSGSGSLANNYTVYSDGKAVTNTDKSRYYQWVALRDSKHNNSLFYVFNTHLSIAMTIGSDSNAGFVAGAILRTKEAAQLAADMQSKAYHCPCFATGDYNSAWERCTLGYYNTKKYNEANPTHTVTAADIGQLNEMTKTGYFADAAKKAQNRITTSSDSVIDHTFYNDYFCEPVEHRTIYETYNSVQPSDHKAIITYFNYRVGARVHTENGTYDVVNKTLTDTTDKNSYTFNIDLLRNIAEGKTVHSYSIVDENGTKLVKATAAPFTVPLTKRKTTFTIQFHNNTTGSYAFNTAKATIYSTATAAPVLTQTGGENCYFADNAWYVPVKQDTSSVVLNATLTDGKLYTDEACTAAVSTKLSNIPGGVSTYYIKSNTGDIFPVKICKETAAIDGDFKNLYCDDGIDSAAIGTVAFVKDDQTVILGENNKRMFATLKEALAATQSGATVRVAPGRYAGSSNKTFSCAADVTLLGNNAGVSPLERHDDIWKKSTNRLPESEIVNGLQLAGGERRYTVKGFSFSGIAQGAFLVTTVSGSSDAQTTYCDFEQNIIDGFGGQSDLNASAIHLNGAYVVKTGKIADNYLCASKDTELTDGYNNVSSDTPLKSTAMRGIFWRNAKGMVVENNMFVDYYDVMYLMGENCSGTKQNGYADYVVQNNRFENCGEAYAPVATIGGETYADVRFLYNDFVRCGALGAGGALNISLSGTSNVPNDCSKISITVFGNRFSECQKGLYLSRSSSSEGDAAQATVRVNQNRFLQINSNIAVDNDLKLNNIILRTWLSKQSYTDYIERDIVQPWPEKWDFGYNYFHSDYRAGGVSNGYVLPYHYINCITRSSAPEGGYAYTKYFEPLTVGIPYYSAGDMTKYRSDSSKSWTEATPVTVMAESATIPADGKPHAPLITAEDGAIISYSTDPDEKRVYGAECPAFSEVGEYTVYYQAEKTGKKVVQGSVKLTIVKNKQTCSFVDAAFTYDGTPKVLARPNAASGSTVKYTYNDRTVSLLPSFTLPGSYTVTVTVTKPYYDDFVATATLTILPAEIDAVTLNGFDGKYDGKSHGVTVNGTLPDKAEILYSVDGGEYVSTLPAYTKPCTHTVTAKITAVGYVEYITSPALIRITPLVMTGISLRGYTGKPDGTRHSPILTGTLPGDSITWYTDGALQSQIPALQSGRHTVTAIVSRTGYLPVTFSADMIFDSSLADCDFVLTEVERTDGIALQIALSPSEAMASHDINILSVGIATAADLAALQQFVQTGVSADVKTEILAQCDTGITVLPAAMTVPKPTAVCAVGYAVIEIDGQIKTVHTAFDIC